MKHSVDLCKITAKFKDGSSYYKYPSLTELYEYLFKQTPKGQHNSLFDVLICSRCYVFMEYNTDLINLLEDMKLII